jgi:hypothetical protein
MGIAGAGIPVLIGGHGGTVEVASGGKSVGDALDGVGAFQTQCIGNVGDREEERKSSGQTSISQPFLI